MVPASDEEEQLPPSPAHMVGDLSLLDYVQVLATGEETCNTGNELDWALVSA